MTLIIELQQSSLACSTTEDEYVVGRCRAQILWIQNQLLDYGFKNLKTPYCVDNISVILIHQNSIQHSKTKHIGIRHHFIKDNMQKGKIKMMYIRTDNQLADIFTKLLDPCYTLAKQL